MEYQTFIENVNIGDTIYFEVGPFAKSVGRYGKATIGGFYIFKYIKGHPMNEYATKSLDFLLSTKNKTCGVILEKSDQPYIHLCYEHIVGVVKTEKKEIENLLSKAEALGKKVRIWWHPESKECFPFSKIDKRWDVTLGIPKGKNGGWSLGSPDESWWFRVTGPNWTHLESSPLIVAAALEDS